VKDGTKSTITEEKLAMFPVHPGRVLKDELQARSLSASALSRALRVPSGRVVEIINGKRAISAETALRLGRYFGTDPQLWMSLQAQYDLARAQRKLGKRIKAEVTVAA
jgi:addiction module HigA family antidote